MRASPASGVASQNLRLPSDAPAAAQEVYRRPVRRRRDTDDRPDARPLTARAGRGTLALDRAWHGPGGWWHEEALRMRVSPALPRGPAQARPQNVPSPLTRLIGREAEVAAVREALLAPEVRLLTLVGAPGIGKTRLALAVARALSAAPTAGEDLEPGAGPEFAGGVCFVPLAPLRDPELVLPAIAQALGVREVVGRPILDHLRAALRDRRRLLVLDNCEHLPAAAPLVGELLAACPGLTVLATSRAPLHVYGEHQYPVPPLALPNLGRRADPVALAEVPAVALLIERAQAVRPDFGLTARNAAAVAEVCVRLDGLPLALELAAARLKLLPPNALLARLGSRLDLLTGGARDRPARHQTLRAALAWSHDLLSAGEQRLLRRLAVFAGGCTLEAAEAVCAFGAEEAVGDGGLPSASPVFDRLAALVDQSLIQETDQPTGEPRFVMLETIREDGLERLEASGEVAEVRRRHAEYYLGLMAAAEYPQLVGQRAGHKNWTEGLWGDFDNLRLALAWSREEAGQGRVEGARLALQTAPALSDVWLQQGQFGEARRWLEWMLAESDDAPTPARVKALAFTGFVAFAQGDHGRASELIEAAVVASRELADERLLAHSLRYLGTVAHRRGAVEQAAAALEESLALYRRLGELWGVAKVLDPLSQVARDQGDDDRAMALAEESVALSRAHGASLTVAGALTNLGLVAWQQGRYRRAAAVCEESLAMYSELGVLWGFAVASCTMGLAAWRLGDHRRAAALLTEGLTQAWQNGHREWIGVGLNYLACVVCDQRDYRRAARLLAATEAVWAELGGAPWPASRADHDRAVCAARAALGEEAFAAAFAQGRAMTLEEAVEDARSPADAVPAAAPAHEPPADRELSLLTPREREVAGLVARGLTDPQLAAALVIGRRTAEKHVASCLRKLGLATRAGLAAWAVERGLAAARPD
jgi:non-specific serine/threonine protein kinase